MPTLLENLTMRLKLFYFELIVLNWELDFFKNPLWLELHLTLLKTPAERLVELNGLRLCEKIFNEKKSYYEHCGNLLSPIDHEDQSHFFGRQLETLEKLEQYLGELYQLRRPLWEKIDFILTAINRLLDLQSWTELQNVKGALLDLSIDLDDIIWLINLNCDISQEKRDAFALLLKDSKESFGKLSASLSKHIEFNAILKIGCEQFLGKSFSAGYELCQNVLLLRNWGEYLRQAIENMQRQCLGRSKVFFALAVKEILINAKGQIQISFYQLSHQKTLNALWRLIIDYLQRINSAESFGLTLETSILEKLKSEEQRLRHDIGEAENYLRSYGWLPEIAATGMRLWTESYYFKMAQGYFEFIEDLTKEGFFKGTALEQSLTPDYLRFFKHSGTVSLLGTDFFLSRYLSGAARYGAMNVLHQMLLPQLESVIYTLERLGVHEAAAVKVAPKVKWTLGFGLSILVGWCNMGLSPARAVFYLLNYISLTLMQELVNAPLEQGKAWFAQDKKVSAKGWDYLVRPLVLFAGQILHSSYLSKMWFSLAQKIFSYAGVNDSANISDDAGKLLSDKGYCLQHRRECEEVVLKTLELNANATVPEVLKSIRRLHLKFHPDRVGHSSDRAVEVLQAKSRWHDIHGHAVKAYPGAAFFPSLAFSENPTLPDSCENPSFPVSEITCLNYQTPR